MNQEEIINQLIEVKEVSGNEYVKEIVGQAIEFIKGK